MVKIICGAHIDGYAANAAYSFVAGTEKVSGRKADAILAAHHAMMAAERIIRDQGTNAEVTEVIAKVCKEYKVNPVEGVLSHKIKKHVIAGNQVIINKETLTQKVDKWVFKPGDVIGLDIYVSTGEGTPKLSE